MDGPALIGGQGEVGHRLSDGHGFGLDFLCGGEPAGNGQDDELGVLGRVPGLGRLGERIRDAFLRS